MKMVEGALSLDGEHEHTVIGAHIVLVRCQKLRHCSLPPLSLSLLSLLAHFLKEIIVGNAQGLYQGGTQGEYYVGAKKDLHAKVSGIMVALLQKGKNYPQAAGWEHEHTPVFTGSLSRKLSTENLI